MNFIGNLIWIVFGGLIMAMGWLVSALFMFCTGIGIPWTPSCFRMAKFSFAPFGKTVVTKNEAKLYKERAQGAFGAVSKPMEEAVTD